MTITNAELAQDISDLITSWSDFMEEFYQWLNGAVDGGPYGDGRYPLTDYAGNTQFLECPAKQSDNVSNNVSGALAHKNAAEAAQTAAENAESNAATSESNALTHKANAQTAETNAAASASNAANDAANALVAKAAIEGRLTVSTSPPSGGADDDIWFYIVSPGSHELHVKHSGTWEQIV